jgi:hypothetical protein
MSLNEESSRISTGLWQWGQRTCIVVTGWGGYPAHLQTFWPTGDANASRQPELLAEIDESSPKTLDCWGTEFARLGSTDLIRDLAAKSPQQRHRSRARRIPRIRSFLEASRKRHDLMRQPQR